MNRALRDGCARNGIGSQASCPDSSRGKCDVYCPSDGRLSDTRRPYAFQSALPCCLVPFLSIYRHFSGGLTFSTTRAISSGEASIRGGIDRGGRPTRAGLEFFLRLGMDSLYHAKRPKRGKRAPASVCVRLKRLFYLSVTDCLMRAYPSTSFFVPIVGSCSLF